MKNSKILIMIVGIMVISLLVLSGCQKPETDSNKDYFKESNSTDEVDETEETDDNPTIPLIKESDDQKTNSNAKNEEPNEDNINIDTSGLEDDEEADLDLDVFADW